MQVDAVGRNLVRRALWLALAGTAVSAVFAIAPGIAGAEDPLVSGSSTTTTTQPDCSDGVDSSTTTTAPAATSTTAGSAEEEPHCEPELEELEVDFGSPAATTVLPTTTLAPAGPSTTVTPLTTSTELTGFGEAVSATTAAPTTSVTPVSVELLAAAQPATCSDTTRRDIPRGDRDHAPRLDADSDGIACESGGDSSARAGQAAGDPLPDTGVDTFVLLALAMIGVAAGGGSMTLAKRRAAS
jgi:LPXTG-motif cell wall-anchored protein